MRVMRVKAGPGSRDRRWGDERLDQLRIARFVFKCCWWRRKGTSSPRDEVRPMTGDSTCPHPRSRAPPDKKGLFGRVDGVDRDGVDGDGVDREDRRCGGGSRRANVVVVVTITR